MARTKEFDPGDALRAAMELFWLRGYEATSMQDLVDHLGIGRASIYATFGNKRELYAAAVRRYSEEMGARNVEQLAAPGSALAAVCATVRSFAANGLSDPDRKGCLVTNTLVECLPADRELGLIAEGSVASLETAIALTLTRARAEGELSADADPRALAAFLVTFLQGVRVLGKSSDPRRLTVAVEQVLSFLE